MAKQFPVLLLSLKTQTPEMQYSGRLCLLVAAEYFPCFCEVKHEKIRAFRYGRI